MPQNQIDVDAILARTAKALEAYEGLQVKKTLPPRKPRKKKGEIRSGKGYIYEYDSDGKPVPKQRLEMQKKLGRKLKPYESVKFLDGNRKNFDPDNLELTIKAGTPLTEIPCPHCGQSLFDCLNEFHFKGSKPD